MAAGTVPASFSGLKSRDAGIGLARGVDFVRVCDSRRIKPQRKKIPVIRNCQPTSEIQLEPASEGSPLLVPRQRYCESLHKTVRRKTCTVMVGNVALVEQVMRIADKGADIVRITVQGKKEADACFDIKNTLLQYTARSRHSFCPFLVALRVAECFDKIRVNPGNFADRRAQFETIEYTNEEYQKDWSTLRRCSLPWLRSAKSMVEQCASAQTMVVSPIV
ncbi:hypothetical protein MLD38_009604 [Melastoma candidum]|uniref:Uncharacterized protein n=1 Tax=Melastoma candidum TaxID=119954 RepID=A0ACB9RX71_9MYRT|nr:hypothetical protein MLD38_009604 [Melastoma candidum]